MELKSILTVLLTLASAWLPEPQRAKPAELPVAGAVWRHSKPKPKPEVIIINETIVEETIIVEEKKPSPVPEPVVKPVCPPCPAAPVACDCGPRRFRLFPRLFHRCR